MLTFSVIACEQEWVQFAHPQAHIAHYLVLVKNKSYVYLLHVFLYSHLCRSFSIQNTLTSNFLTEPCASWSAY